MRSAIESFNNFSNLKLNLNPLLVEVFLRKIKQFKLKAIFTFTFKEWLGFVNSSETGQIHWRDAFVEYFTTNGLYEGNYV